MSLSEEREDFGYFHDYTRVTQLSKLQSNESCHLLEIAAFAFFIGFVRHSSVLSRWRVWLEVRPARMGDNSGYPTMMGRHGAVPYRITISIGLLASRI